MTARLSATAELLFSFCVQSQHTQSDRVKYKEMHILCASNYTKIEESTVVLNDYRSHVDGSIQDVGDAVIQDHVLPMKWEYDCRCGVWLGG